MKLNLEFTNADAQAFIATMPKSDMDISQVEFTTEGVTVTGNVTKSIPIVGRQTIGFSAQCHIAASSSLLHIRLVSISPAIAQPFVPFVLSRVMDKIQSRLSATQKDESIEIDLIATLRQNNIEVDSLVTKIEHLDSSIRIDLAISAKNA